MKTFTAVSCCCCVYVKPLQELLLLFLNEIVSLDVIITKPQTSLIVAPQRFRHKPEVWRDVFQLICSCESSCLPSGLKNTLKSVSSHHKSPVNPQTVSRTVTCFDYIPVSVCEAVFCFFLWLKSQYSLCFCLSTMKCITSFSLEKFVKATIFINSSHVAVWNIKSQKT